MKTLLVSGAALGVALVLCGQAPPADPLLRALHDEVERSRKLTITDLEPPYFVQYIVDDADTFSVSASLGGVISRGRSRSRAPEVQVRVGDYQSDNTNFAGGRFGGSRYGLGRFPIDDDYMAMRRHLWLETDSAYKGAVEALSRKRAALRNLTENDKLNDFAHAEPLRSLGQFRPLSIDENAWVDRIRALSAVFARFPDLRYSTVTLEASEGGYYVVNSEGTEVREPERVTFVRARALAQAADGSSVRDAVTIHALDSANMPAQAAMERETAARGRPRRRFRRQRTGGPHRSARAARIVRRDRRPHGEGLAWPAAVWQLRRGSRGRGPQAAAPGGKGRTEGLPADPPAGAWL